LKEETDVWQAVLELPTDGGLGADIYVSAAGQDFLTGSRTLPERYPTHPCLCKQPSSAPNHDPAMIDMALTHARPAPPTPTAFDRCLQAGLQAMLLGPLFCDSARMSRYCPKRASASATCMQPGKATPGVQGCSEVRNHLAGPPVGALKHRMVAN